MLAREARSPSGLPADVTVISIHPMYSPRQVGLASFLGGPLGGGWLMALNYKRLGEPENARRVIWLSVLGMAAVVAVGHIGPLQATWLLALLPLLVMRWVAGELQGARYDRHVELGGSRGSSWRAAGLGLASLAIYFAVIVGVGVVRMFATTPDKVMIGDSSVFYTEGVPRAEAQRVGDALVALKVLRRDASWGVEVTRDHGRRVVGFVLKDDAFAKDKLRLVYHRLAEALSRDAYDGAPVDIWLVDRQLRPHIELSWEDRPRAPRAEPAAPVNQPR